MGKGTALAGWCADISRLQAIATRERLFSTAIYHDQSAWKGLTYRHIYSSQDSQRHFADATVAVDVKSQPVNYGIVVATNPLSPAGWEKFEPGELKVLFQGKIEHEFKAGKPERKMEDPPKKKSLQLK